MTFEKFHLKEKYRKNLEHLSKENLCQEAFEKYTLDEVSDIFTYYEISIDQYVLSIAKKRFIDKPNPYFACLFAKKFLKARWTEAEKIIIKNPSMIFCYIKDVVKGRWKECEPYLCKDAIYSYWYAKTILKGRFPKAENFIKKNPLFAFAYSRDILKEPWKEAEIYIKKDEKTWMLYQEWKNEFLKYKK